jgi:hypothetical protein
MKSTSLFRPVIATIVIAAALVVVLRLLGRRWWCACGELEVWAGDVHGPHMSQHLIDPYAFTHLLHGLLLYGACDWLLPRLSFAWRFVLSIVVEAGWEVLENTQFAIERYRDTTIAAGYVGDSILNAVMDVFFCAAGFAAARTLGLRWSIALFVAVELILLATVRDNLTLNLVMLLVPLDAVKTWQTAN